MAGVEDGDCGVDQRFWFKNFKCSRILKYQNNLFLTHPLAYRYPIDICRNSNKFYSCPNL